MVKLEWKLNGRAVPSNRVADELGKSIRQAAADKMKHAIAGVRCPVHAGSARNIRVANTGSKDELHLNGVLRRPEAGDWGAPSLGDRRTLN